jgi:PAS domain S-box-containing protein
MKTQRFNLRWFIIGSIAIVATVFDLWLLLECFCFTDTSHTRRQDFALLQGAVASGLVMTWAAIIIYKRMREKENTELKFRSLLEAAPDALVIMDRNGRVILVNRRAEQLFGYSRVELLGKPADNLVRRQAASTPIGPGAGDASVATSKNGSDQPEALACRKDGSTVPIEISFNPLETTDGFLVISIIRDITERIRRDHRRAARHAVRRILTEAANLTCGTPDLLQATGENLGWEGGALWTVDRHTQLPRLVDTWQRRPVPGAVPGASIHDQIALAGDKLVSGVLRNGKPLWISNEAQHPHSSGWLMMAVEGSYGILSIPIVFGSEVLGVIACFGHESQEPDDNLLETMVSIGGQVGQFIKRKQAEEAVYESEARKAAILEAALDAIITIDHQGKILEFNPAAESIFGYPRGEVLGKAMADLIIPSALREQCRQGLARHLITGTSLSLGKRLEMSALRADGSEFPVEITVTRIRTEGMPLFTGYLRDISEHKRTEEALRRTEEQFRQAQKMEAIGRLAGGVAHDFNNLLTVITGYSDLLLNTLRVDDPSRELIGEIAKSADRAATLTRQLLAFSRKQVLAPKVMDLNTSITEMLNLLRRLISEDIQLRTTLAPGLYPVKVDRGQIEQVIMNLAVNARDAMPRGGQLTIETSNTDLDETLTRSLPELRPGPCVRLTVSDTGCGMDETVKARLFEPFFTTKAVGKGTGLGLATVYGIIKQSEGHITVWSEPGQGATFKIYLPGVREELPSAPKKPVPAPAVIGSETVLLVEDEEGVRTLTRHILQTSGYTVLEARHGLEALQVSEQQSGPIHLMVTDVVMPEMNGPQLARRILQLRPSLKVLFLSGYTDSTLLHNGLLDASRNFLQKPFAPEDLKSKVREVLSD